MCSNCDLFRQTVLQKCGIDINSSLDYGSWVKKILHPAIQTTIEQHFGRFFHQIKVRQPIGRQDSMQTIEQAGGWIHFCMKQLSTLKSFQIFKSEIKKSKTYSGWCPFQSLSNGTVKAGNFVTFFGFFWPMPSPRPIFFIFVGVTKLATGGVISSSL